MSLHVFHSNFFWIFIVFYLLHEIIHIGLDVLNFRYVKKHKEVPECFQGRITQSIFLQSQEYTLEKTTFSLTAHIALIPFFWFLVFRDGFNVMDFYAAKLAGTGTLSHSVVFCLLVGLYFGVINMPFKLYSVFVIEEKYGFNKMSFGLFVVDFIKSTVLGLVIGVPLLFLIFWFMKSSGSLWWLWVWGAIVLFQLVFVAIYPRFLAPIFNKFKPLEDEDLKDQIMALAKKIKFKLSGVFMMDGSRRSSHSNAYFAGMGKYRRIVLFDTLINQLTQDELLSVLAHEMGHNVKKHIQTMMILSSVYMLIGFFLMSLIIGWGDFYLAFNINSPSHHAALVIFAIAFETFTFALTPVMNYLSRKNEFEADRFAVQTTENKAASKSSLLKLTRDNLSNLTPHPAYSFYHYSHPTVAERIKAIEEI